MSQLGQQEAVAKEYFGNPDDEDSIGLCAQLLEGAGIFAHLFDVEEKIQTDPQGAAGNCKTVTLILKPHLHLMPNTKIIVSDHPRDINLSLLHSSTLGGNNVIKAKALVTCAQEHIKNCKKALSVVTHARSPYKPYVTTGNLPSGMTLNDYYLFVRKKMFVLTGCACAATSKANQKAIVQRGMGPAIPALTAHVDSIDNSTLTMKSTRRSINAINTRIADEDEASVTTGASFKSCNPTNSSITSNDGRELEIDLNPGAVHNQVTVDDDQEGEDKMPQDWTFPGFISFVLLGPIVPTCLMPYRSEIMMPTLPPTIPGDTSNGRAAMRKERVLSKSCKKGVVVTSPSNAPAVSLQQKIMVAGIAQSQMLMEQRQKNRANDRTIAFYQKKVAAQRMLLDQSKYVISVTPPEAPDRSELLVQLRVMNDALANAVKECLNAEEAILKDNAENDAKAVGGHSKLFIDLTIATVLGTAAEEDDCEVIAVTQDRDSAVTASASAVSSSKQRKANPSGSTPISSNKKRKANPPVQGWTMTSRVVRSTEDISPLSFEDSLTGGEDDESK